MNSEISGEDQAKASGRAGTLGIGYRAILIGLVALGWGSIMVFQYFIFIGSFTLIDLGLGETAALGLDAGLCLMFFIIHSGMVRRSFRSRLESLVHHDFHAAIYTVCSGVALFALVGFWQQSSHTLVALEGLPRWSARIVFVAAFIGLNWAMSTLNAGDMMGITALKNRMRGSKQKDPIPFSIRGPYRWVRHPMYALSLVMMWSCPDVSVDRLLFNLLTTPWIIIGAMLEERDLVADFGDEYRRYKTRVPMLIPRRLRPDPPQGQG